MTYYDPVQQQQVQTRPKRQPRVTGGGFILAAVTLVLGCLGGIGVGYAAAKNSTTGTPAAGDTPTIPASAATTAAGKTTPAKPAQVTIGADGTYLVPAEVKPGTYRAKVPADSFGCYWARLKDTSGDIDAIITSDVGNGGDTETVTVASSDKAFETRGCGIWVKIS